MKHIIEDNVLKEVHRIQQKMQRQYKGLSWDQEAGEIDRVAKKIAKQYGYRIYPKEKSPYATE